MTPKLSYEMDILARKVLMKLRYWFSVLICITIVVSPEKSFCDAQVYNIPDEPTVFNFTTHAYNMERIGDGVRFSFVASLSDTVAIIADNTPDYRDVFKSIVFYEKDSTFTTTAGSKNGTSPIVFPVNVIAGNRYYCMVKPMATGAYSNDFRVHIGLKCTLSVVADGNGTTSGSNNQIWTHFSAPIEAFESPVSYFSHWTSSDGADIENSTSNSTSIFPTVTNVTATAHFLQKSIHEITFESDTFNFDEHGGNGRTGVLFKFTPPSADSFYITLASAESYSIPFRITYYNDDSTFSTADSQNVENSEIFEFRAQEAGNDLYFRISPANPLYRSSSFALKANPFYKLIILPDPVATVSPVDTFVMKSGEYKDINVSVSGLFYFFEKWQIVSGSVRFADSLRQSTTVYIDSSDATIKAMIKHKEIYDIRAELDTFQYATHGDYNSGGVLLCFTAPSIDSFYLDLQKLSYHNSYIYYYGQDSTFTNHSDYHSSNFFTFSSSAIGEKHYFRIYPSSSSYNDCQFTTQVQTFYTLTVKKDVNGTVTTDTTLKIRSGFSQNLPFPQYFGKYFFDKWTVVSGSATIADSTDSLSSIEIQENTTVKSVFLERPLRIVSEEWDTVAYTSVDGGTRGGILFSFTLPAADSFLVEIGSAGYSHTMSVFGYDTNSSCSSAVNTYQSSSHQIQISADSGETYYFRVAPYRLYDTTQTMRIRYYRYHNLTILNELAGVLSSDSVTLDVLSNDTIEIDTFSISNRFYFDHWETVSGTAFITDSINPNTSIVVHSDAVVKAVYLERPVRQLGFVWDTVGYQDVEGGTRGGILFSYTSEEPDTFVLTVDRYPDLHNKYLIYYGTDSTCSHEIWNNRNSSVIDCPFSTKVPDETVYFRVVPYYESDTANSISVRLFRFCKVFLKAENGGVSPFDTTIVRENGTLDIVTWPEPYSYYFVNWELVSGSAVFENDSNSTTKLTVDSTDVVAEAIYQPKTLYPITEHDSTYVFGPPHGGSNWCGGVIMNFTAPRADSFIVQISQADYNIEKTMFYYGTNDSFVTVLDSVKGNYAYFIFEASSAGEKHYFRIFPSNINHDNNPYDYKIRYKDIYYIDFSASTGGIAIPPGPLPVSDSIPVIDTARLISSLYYFDKWVTVSGNVTYFYCDSSDSIIAVAPAGGNASLRAEFIKKDVHEITNRDTNFTYNVHGFPKGGVLLSYTAERADTHNLVVNLPSQYRYNIDYFDTSSGFDSITDYAHNINSIDYSFKFYANSAGTTCYFRLTPVDFANYEKSFNIRVDTTILLKISCDNSISTTNPADSIRFLKGGTINIEATPKNEKDRFLVWRILSGGQYITIADSNSQVTTITASSDAHIQAVFESKPVHEIGFPLDTLCYATDGAPHNSGGVLMKYVAPAADSFVIDIINASTYERNLNFYYYGTTSSFIGPRREMFNQNTNLHYTFRCEAPGDTHYFRIEPYNSSYYTDSIGVRVLGYSNLEIITDGRGTTVPQDSVRLLQTKPYSIKAEALSNFYQFWKWTVLRGNAVIDDTNSISTKITITDTGNARIQVSFDSYPVNDIPKMPNKASFCYNELIPPGIFCKFISEKADSFLLYVKHYNPLLSKDIIYFGTDHRFTDSSIVKIYKTSNTNDTIFRFKALAENANHYFRITPANGYDDSLDIMWIPFSTLTVRSEYGGKVTPAEPVTRPADDTVHISTRSIGDLFEFDKWVISDGSAVINNPLAMSTWVRLSENGDAIVEASYNIKPHDTLFVEDDTNGITVPMGMVLVDTTKDTLVTAHENSYWIFDKWEIVSGNPQIEDPSNKSTRVKLKGNARIKACFKPDPNAKPSLVINSIICQKHPEIELTATLRDHLGNTISGADSIEFLLMQDTTFPSFTARNISEVRHGISVSLVIDRSESMTENSRMDSAVVAAKTFIDEMDTLDRAAVVSFSTGTHVEQPITGNKEQIKSALDGIAPFGQTAILDGAYEGIEQLINETNTRSVILFSDGFDVGSTRSLSSVIDLARKNNVTIYSIAVGPEAFASVDTTLRPLADSTNGYFFFARSASELTELYKRIKEDIESRYLIRYVSPDKIINGDTHTVYLSTELSGIAVSDTGEWIETGDPPVIKITPETEELIANEQSSGTGLPITVWIIDDESPLPVRKIFFRTAGTGGSYLEANMVHLRDSTYRFTIPGAVVKKPGIDFYITAVDSQGMSDEKGPYRINIDNSGPLIIHTPPTILLAYKDLELKAFVSDSDTVSIVRIYYKSATALEFVCDTMVEFANDTFKVTIDGETIFDNYLEYYLEAEDKFLTLSRNPVFDNYKVNVDQPPRIIFHGNKIWNEGDSVTGEITAVDPEGETVNLKLVSPLPKGASCDSIEPNKLSLGWQTGPGSSGEYQLIFRTSDKSYTVTDTIILKINDKDYDPVISAPKIHNATEGDTIRLIISGTDPDGEIVTFTANSMPAAAARFSPLPGDNDTSKAQLFWATGMHDQGTYKFIFTATDGTRSVTDSISIIIADSSFFAPVLHATTTDTVIPKDKEIRVSIWATDEDQTIPSLQLLGMPEGSVFEKNAEGDSGVFIWTPSGQKEILLTAIAFDKVDVEQVDTLHIKMVIAQYNASASLLDTNGNGYLDRIMFQWDDEACLKESLPQPGEWIDSLGIFLSNGTYLALDPVKMIRVDSANAYFQLNEMKDILHTGYEQATIKCKSYSVTKKELPTVVTNITDMAGPVIRRAIYYPGLEEINEERKITVYFSEPVLWQQVQTQPNDFIRYFRNGKLEKSAFSSQCFLKTISEDSVVIVLDYEMQVSIVGDSLSLQPAASDGRSHITDATESRNLPNENNRRVPLVLADKPVNVTAAVYDTNGEGHIDLIMLSIEQDYSLPAEIPNVNSAISSIMIKPIFSNIENKLHPISLVKGETSNQLVMVIDENLHTELETGWDEFTISFDSSFVSGEGMQFKLRQVYDNAGPVISKATVFPAALESKGQYDTLRVEFSEPILWTGKTPSPDKLFNFFTGNSSGRDLRAFKGLLSRSILYFDSVSIKIMMDNGFVFKPNTDSLNIIYNRSEGTGEIRDLSETWPHANNRKVPVNYQKNNEFTVTICPNPYNPDIVQNNGLGKSGMAIIVECDTIASLYSGKVTIFDALGNIVLRDKKMLEGSLNDLWLSYVWDARDDNRRDVGRGVYFAKIIVIRKSDGKEKKYGEKLGVMRAAK
ncbi:MAG: VWA domain-containing protein [Fibrobacter sp.]|nr:VWA domain-containing protein [Fibrobacter sp.]